MFCVNCGNKLNSGDNNCSNCGTPVVSNENNVVDNMNNAQYQQPQQMNYNAPIQHGSKETGGILKKILIGFVIFIAIFVFIIIFVSLTSKKLVCESSQGNITLMYKDDRLTGYTVKNATFDLDKGNEMVKQIGLDEYLKEFESWFKVNTTDGKCVYK